MSAVLWMDEALAINNTIFCKSIDDLIADDSPQRRRDNPGVFRKVNTRALPCPQDVTHLNFGFAIDGNIIGLNQGVNALCIIEGWSASDEICGCLRGH